MSVVNQLSPKKFDSCVILQLSLSKLNLIGTNFCVGIDRCYAVYKD